MPYATRYIGCGVSGTGRDLAARCRRENLCGWLQDAEMQGSGGLVGARVVVVHVHRLGRTLAMAGERMTRLRPAQQDRAGQGKERTGRPDGGRKETDRGRGRRNERLSFGEKERGPGGRGEQRPGVRRDAEQGVARCDSINECWTALDGAGGSAGVGVRGLRAREKSMARGAAPATGSKWKSKQASVVQEG
jgi:hypothetical protein